jgi:hypothetical protein
MNWPTPAVFDTTGGPYPTELTLVGFRSFHNGVPHGAKLSDAVNVEPSRSGPPPTASGPLGPLGPDSRSSDGSRRESWATPTGDDANNATRESGAFQSLTPQAVALWGTHTKAGTVRSEEFIRDAMTPAEYAAKVGGKLNPSWVETLMGLPIGWTQLPHKFSKPKKGTKGTP